MIFQEMIQGPQINELIVQEYLVPCQYYAPSKPDLDGLKMRMGDYQENQLSERMDTAKLVGDIPENWSRIAPDRQTVVFATGVRHSIHIRDRFRDAGILAEHIDGTTPKDERDKILEDLATGEIQVVSNCMVLTEGWDCPPVSCCILARPTKSIGLYLQMAGRILRPYPDKVNAIIIDHAGSIFEHGFVEDHREWSLDPEEKIQDRQKKANDKPKSPITCEDCKTVYHGRPDCPKCGKVPVKKGKALDFVDGELGRIERDGNFQAHQFSKYQKERFYRELKFIQEDRGYKFGWIACKYKDRFDVWPGNIRGDSLPPSPETKSYIRKQSIAYAKEQRCAG
jgi:DNA repair protein RadD